jgi:hypothetical protein
MTARTKEQILTEFLANTGRSGRLRQELASDRSHNWLLALMLHSFIRFADGAQLSDLEASIVNAFKQHGYNDAELTGQGRLAQKLDQAVRAELFGPRFAALSDTAPYTLAQLTADAPGIVAGSLAQAGAAESVKQQVAGAGPATYTFKATKFRCNHRGTDSVLNPKCEYYFVFGSTDGKGKTTTSRSMIFQDVDTGDTRDFPATDGKLWGPSGLATALPSAGIGVLVSIWEHDNGDPKEVEKGVGAAFAAVALVLTATGVAAWVGAVTAGVGGVITWLIGFMDDDFVAKLPFDAAPLAKLATSVGSSVTSDKRLTATVGKDDLTVTFTSTRVS